MQQRHWLIALLTLLVFVAATWGRKWLYGHLGISRVGSMAELFVVVYTWYWLPAVLLAAWVAGWRKAFSALGLQASVLTGLAVGFVGTLPMLIGYGVHGSFAWPVHPNVMIFQASLFPGVMEEILYRGLLFGLLFRYARWGFLPAALVGAALFGAGHLYQGETPMSALAAFAVTGAGAVWFAWLYVEWRNNLWVPITFHVLMNLYWGLFGMGDTAIGSSTANLYRLATILLSVVLTFAYARNQGGFAIHRRRWLRPG